MTDPAVAAARSAFQRARTDAAEAKVGTVRSLGSGSATAGVSVAGATLRIPVVRHARSGLTVGDTVLVLFCRPNAWVVGAL